MAQKKIKKVLIANRGEIAMRIIRTLKAMEIKTVAVHSEADAGAMHVSFADESVCIGPSETKSSYANIKNIISAAILTNVDAIHPGYGFLSESANFASIVQKHGFIFLGPTPEQIALFGNKISAKKIMHENGIQVVPGNIEPVFDFDKAYLVAKNMQFPILIKASESGGGKGQRVVNNIEELEEKFYEAKTESQALSNVSEIYIESFIAHPRHVEFQIIGDGLGEVTILGTRDCSLQRKRQKVVEEGPANIAQDLYEETVIKIKKIMAKYAYRSLGTVEFLEQDGKLFFIEVNPRIQVEHPVTEMITKLDLIKLQIDVANGELTIKQKDVNITGHAIESRINAENPFTFNTSPGTIEQLLAPGGPNVRVDSAIYPGWNVPPYYDSLVMKIITFGVSRQECLRRHKNALQELAISGIENSSELHLWLLEQEEFLENKHYVTWLEEKIKEKLAKDDE